MTVYEIRNKMTGRYLADKDMNILKFEFLSEAYAYLSKCKYNLNMFNIENFEIKEIDE